MGTFSLSPSPSPFLPLFFFFFTSFCTNTIFILILSSGAILVPPPLSNSRPYYTHPSIHNYNDLAFTPPI